jgi:glycosyltransferase involved in cell wall biosynthesis
MADNNRKRVTWVRRSVLDYRIPVFKALDEALGSGLSLVYSRDHTPARVRDKLSGTLGERAIGLAGEKTLGFSTSGGFANRGVSLMYQPGVLKQIRQTAPEVLIGDGFSSWTSFALLYKLRNRLPLVVCYERTFHTERNVQWYRKIYRRSVLKFIDAMCCNGIQSVEYTRSLGMPPFKITMPNMAADTQGLELASSAVTPEEKAETQRSWNARGLVYLYVGNLIPRKGLQYLLEAWAMMEQAYGDEATLVLVGQGPEKAALERQADSLALRNVRFAGAVDYDSLSRCYASADVFVIPTLEDNWSLVVPEAMACGLPVLCSKYNGCWPELVHPDRNGWIFDPLNGNDLFYCMERCLKNKSRLLDMGRNSREIVTGFTPDIAVKSILKAVDIAQVRNWG